MHVYRYPRQCRQGRRAAPKNTGVQNICGGRDDIDAYGLTGINAGPLRVRRAAYQHCQTEAETGIYGTENVYALQKLSKHNRAGEKGGFIEAPAVKRLCGEENLKRAFSARQ
ncbi:MAG: hypothetical protein Q4G07_08100 [Oscillospiraceae bacterium]|nr:hypothetical protein [Oscillospiraceae bacterium]